MSQEEQIENKNSNHEFEEFMDMLGSAEAPPGRSKDAAWNILVDTIEHQPTKITKTRRLPLKTIVSIAASLFVILGGWYSYLSLKTETFTTGNGQMATVALPDQSVVRLNSGSSVSYKPFGWNNRRRIVLEGEAFFEVKKGNEFVVESSGNTVTVLGTSFNIYSRNGRFTVECYTGKVRVETPSTRRVILTKGEAVRTLASTPLCDTLHFNANIPVAWTKGKYYFNNEDLNSVFEEMERQFNVTISRPIFKGRVYTGFFSRSNLKSAMDNVCLPMAIEYAVIDSTHIKIK